MYLRKITAVSVITLRAHFSQGIVKFDTLPNLLLTLDNINSRWGSQQVRKISSHP